MNHHYNQQDPPAMSYPSPVIAYPPPPTVSAPPPMGYPSKDDVSWDPKQSIPQKTTGRGDGFWEGCCAALCCCCILDCCF